MHPIRRLILFAKAPVPGAVKSRLCPPLRPEDAARLAAAFLLDEVTALGSLPGVKLSIAFTPPDSAGCFRRVLGEGSGVPLRPQARGDSGERLALAFAAGCQDGASVVLVGSDTPDLPPARISAAFATLESDDVDVVLGPAVDGGYYLVGARRIYGCLFDRIPWSTGDVLQETLQRAASASLKVHLLPLWEDVYTPADLERLRQRLGVSDPRTAPVTTRLPGGDLVVTPTFPRAGTTEGSGRALQPPPRALRARGAR